MTAAIGSQAQNVSLLPGFSATTLVVDSLACSSPDARCPKSSNGSFQTFDAEQASSDFGGRGQDIQADEWGAQQANILNLDGFGHYYAESMVLQSRNAQNVSLVSEEHAIVVSDNYTVQYPGGAFYTMSTGFVSLR